MAEHESQAMIGYGMIFACSADGGTTYVDVAEVYDITPPSEATETVDVTHSQSPGRYREFIEALIDGGECTFSMNFVPGSASDKLIRAQRGQGRIPCRITFPNGVEWRFKGVRTGYQPAAPLDDKMTADVTYKISGPTLVDDEEPANG
jgi:predicted secreted protein